MLYLSPYKGTGVRLDPYRPKYDIPGWTAIDLRADATIAAGYCFLDILSRTEPDLILLGSDESITLSARQKSDVTAALGIDVSGATNIGDLLELVLFETHAGRHKPVRGSSLTQTQEAYLQRRRIVSRFSPENSNTRGLLDPSDNFNRADEDPITGNWTAPNTAQPRIVSNELAGASSNGNAFAAWTNDAWGDDHYSEFVFVAGGSDSDGGPATRITNQATPEGYLCSSFTGGELIAKFVAGSFSSVATVTTADISATDVFRMEVEGSTLRYIINSSEVTGSPGTDTSLTSGEAGVFFWRPGYRADTWQGEDLGAGPTTSPHYYYQNQQLVR